jgi:hypothetical protein
MSAFTADGDFMPRLPAHPMRADALTDPSFGRLLAITRHSDVGRTSLVFAQGTSQFMRSPEPGSLGDGGVG